MEVHLMLVINPEIGADGRVILAVHPLLHPRLLLQMEAMLADSDAENLLLLLPQAAALALALAPVDRVRPPLPHLPHPLDRHLLPRRDPAARLVPRVPRVRIPRALLLRRPVPRALPRVLRRRRQPRIHRATRRLLPRAAP